MIFVTLGTQDKDFSRLLKVIEKAINLKYINEEVIVQSGMTNFKSDKMKIYNLLSIDEFDFYIKKCDLLITHGGVGSILSGLRNGKKVIAAPRLKQFNEHENDHQVQIVDEFARLNYLLKLDDFDELGEKIQLAKTFKFNKYKSNNTSFVNLIDSIIEDF